MHIYDVYVPLISNFERNYTYDEAVNEVLEATHIFGDEYVNILKQGYKDIADIWELKYSKVR